jgi:phosphatidylglycerophosphate synthase
MATALGNAGIRPNAVSVLSIAFAALAGFALWLSGDRGGDWLLLLTAAIAIQLRLLCNMLDGLLAVEGGFKSELGDLYNEIPDRVADVAILVGAGYAARTLPFGEILGWSAALVAVMTAYLRLLAGSLGAQQLFIGPMAKQHRMFVMTVGCLLAAIEYAQLGTVRALWLSLIMIVAGSIITFFRRLSRLASELKSR